VSSAAVCLGLVRRANRDGHSMRTYEVPAMRGCVLTERTADHEALFGADRDAVAYFSTIAEAVTQARALLDAAEMRARLAARAHDLITGSAHTYADRLTTILRNTANWLPPRD
jgi:spore maturation protein CgeB